MPKFGIKLKRPKPWSRRAKSDGSCIPLIKSYKTLHESANLLLLRRIFFGIAALLAISVAGFFVWISLEAAGLFAWFGYSTSMVTFGDFIRFMQWLCYATGLFFLIYFSAHVSSIIRFRTKIVRSRFQLCPCCGYDLSNRLDNEPCPECGQQISRRELIRIWCKALH